MTRAAAAVFMLAVLGAAAAAADIPFSERKSGYDFIARETRAMQDDDSANPATLWVLDGETLWQRKEGSAGKSCADCHGDAGTSMKGVAARYPGFNAVRLRKQGAAGAHSLYRGAIARHADRHRG
jgi:sulfur-oxidizing protein SoxA